MRRPYMSGQTRYVFGGAVLFLYGSLAHLLLLRLYVGWAYRPPADRSFVDRPLVNVALAALGGAWVAAFMLWLLRWTRAKGPPGALAVVWRAALLGALATPLALETFYLLASVSRAAAAYRDHAARGLGRIGWFFLWMLEIHTAGILPVILSPPFAACCGAIAGVLVLWLSRLPS